MRKFKLLGFVLSTVLIISSCAIEKRMHQPGYHIAKKSNTKQYSAIDKQEDLTSTKNDVAKADLYKAKKTKKNQTEAHSKVEKTEEVEKTNTQQASNKEEVKSKKVITNSENLFKKGEKLTTSHTGIDGFFSAQNEKLESSTNSLADTMTVLILILCFFLPPLAVWLMTEDIKKTLLSILLSILFWFPGVIYALYIFFKRH